MIVFFADDFSLFRFVYGFALPHCCPCWCGAVSCIGVRIYPDPAVSSSRCFLILVWEGTGQTRDHGCDTIYFRFPKHSSNSSLSVMLSSVSTGPISSS
uniref:Putative secreted protein n=1 Tax=Anopheles darlingi TaxID=43151 RepID=A0A2M4D411_ANODA